MLTAHLAADPAARRMGSILKLTKAIPGFFPGIGKLLRKTSMNEIPQLWNIFNGPTFLRISLQASCG
jgi:hypothetical protein